MSTENCNPLGERSPEKGKEKEEVGVWGWGESSCSVEDLENVITGEAVRVSAPNATIMRCIMCSRGHTST